MQLSEIAKKMSQTTPSIEQEITAPTTGNPRLSKAKSGYIPTLDGWRTIAIGAVIFYHSRPIQAGGFSLENLQNFGDRGVQLFFAISGILICSRLLEEQRRCGRILSFAVLSYYVIEKPFIRLGHRLAPPATPGRKDLS